MRAFAISDLHVGFPANLQALEAMRAYPDDGLVLAGDVGETAEQLESTLDIVQARFRHVVWCPGNHELWTIGAGAPSGEAKYQQLVELCERRGVITPESEYPIWKLGGEHFVIVPMFLLYDYTFRPDHIAPDAAVAWAAEAGLRCADEELLSPAPYASRAAWCAARCVETERRIEHALRHHDCRTILINHFPLKRALARLALIPRFEVWCGTRTTEDWHNRFRAAYAISGHLHIRRTVRVDDTVFQEVSLGYPRQWDVSRGVDAYLCPIAPEPVRTAAQRERSA
jgi:hypothetical protein